MLNIINLNTNLVNVNISFSDELVIKEIEKELNKVGLKTNSNITKTVYDKISNLFEECSKIVKNTIEHPEDSDFYFGYLKNTFSIFLTNLEVELKDSYFETSFEDWSKVESFCRIYKEIIEKIFRTIESR